MRLTRGWACLSAGVVLGAVLGSLLGCGQFKPKPVDAYVYVTAKQGFLRDRVAAVSNRVASVGNGDKLKVLDHGRHFLKVQTGDGKIGWIEERSVATPETAAAFDAMKQEHERDPEIAGAVTRDQVYMHLKPGRESDRFYLLAEGEKLKLIQRSIVTKLVNPQMVARAQRPVPEAVGTHAVRKDKPLKAGAAAGAAAEAAVAPAMEDWWLVRDTQGHTGWLFGRMLDVDAPPTLTRYAEGQKFVGAYVLTMVHDEGAPTEQKDLPIYVAVMNSYKAGLPYDFDQVRVFTWSLNHHRYETAFRERNVEGYLPVTIGKVADPTEKGPLGLAELPSFTYKVLAADAPPVVPDPVTGAMKPSKTVTRTFRLEGNLVRRVGGPGSDAIAHPEPVVEKKGKKRK